MKILLVLVNNLALRRPNGEAQKFPFTSVVCRKELDWPFCPTVGTELLFPELRTAREPDGQVLIIRSAEWDMEAQRWNCQADRKNPDEISDDDLPMYHRAFARLTVECGWEHVAKDQCYFSNHRVWQR